MRPHGTAHPRPAQPLDRLAPGRGDRPPAFEHARQPAALGRRRPHSGPCWPAATPPPHGTAGGPHAAAGTGVSMHRMKQSSCNWICAASSSMACCRWRCELSIAGEEESPGHRASFAYLAAGAGARVHPPQRRWPPAAAGPRALPRPRSRCGGGTSSASAARRSPRRKPTGDAQREAGGPRFGLVQGDEGRRPSAPRLPASRPPKLPSSGPRVVLQSSHERAQLDSARPRPTACHIQQALAQEPGSPTHEPRFSPPPRLVPAALRLALLRAARSA